MSFITIIQSTLASVAAFLLWSFLFYGFFLLRNKWLERQLTRLIRPERAHPGSDRVNIVCANGTDVRVTVRDVRLITGDDSHVSLTYIGDTGDVIHPQKKNALIKPGRRTLMAGREKAGLLERGFVELPAQTAGLWALTQQQMADSNERFLHCVLIVDYPTLFNTRRLMIVMADDGIVESINENLGREVHDEGQASANA